MKKNIIYEAMDGTEFRSERERLEYDVLNIPLKHIKEICERSSCDRTTCPLFSSEDKTCAVMNYIDGFDSPENWGF